jgi:hypothetical protein
MANAFVPGVLVGAVGALMAVWWAGLVGVQREVNAIGQPRLSNPVVSTDVPLGTQECEHIGWTWDIQPVLSKSCFKASVEAVVRPAQNGTTNVPGTAPPPQSTGSEK